MFAQVFGLGACEIVDPGPPAGVANQCVVSPSYFLSNVVPELLERHDCANPSEGGCHDVDNGASAFRLERTDGTLTPLPEDPLEAWPGPWQNNFEASAFQLSCDSAERSPLYSKPAGGDTLRHEGGNTFSANGPELDLISAWLDGA